MPDTSAPVTEWIFESLPLPVAFIDIHRKVVSCNPVAARLLGYAVTEIAGRTVEELAARVGDPALPTLIEQVLRSGKPGATELAYASPDNPQETRHFNVHLEPEHDESGALRGVLLVGEDITSWREVLKQRQRLARDKELGDALNRINVLIHSTQQFEDIMQGCCVETAVAVGAESAAIYIPEEHDWVARYTYGRLDVLRGRHFTDGELRDSIRAMSEGQTIMINDAQADPDVGRDLVAVHGVRAVLDVGLHMAERPVGDFALYYHTPGKRFTEAEREFLEKVGASVGLALQNADRFNKIRQAEAALRASDALLNAIMENTRALVALKDADGRFLKVNRRYEDLFGIPVEALEGKSVFDLFPPETATVLQAYGKRVVETGSVVEYEETFPQGEGARTYATVESPMFDDAHRVSAIVRVSTDITDLKRIEERSSHMAQHDSLTGLPNRRLLLELLDPELRKAQRHANRIALLFLDLDHFKTVNDTLGHDCGDELLKEVAHRLSARVRRSDIVSRLGGDEFIVVLTELVEAGYAQDVAEAIIDTFKQPFHLADQMLYTTTSIGISLFPDDGDTAEVLLRRADLAMYAAKDQGRNTYRFYNSVLERRTHERSRIESGLRHALEHGELRVHYQPEVELRTGRLIAVEALARWQHPELGLLEPARFIPIAEESDLITAVDDWMLRTVCAQARGWLDQGVKPVCVGVNLSARRFESADLVDWVRGVLAENRLLPEHLKLEVTESIVMRHIDQATVRMRELGAIGVSMEIDDFGTGYSSLTYLRRLPVGKIKIDRSFVHGIAAEADATADSDAIIRAVIALAHTLNKRVIAEGVETDVQRDFLDASGCDEAQGFLYSEPLPADRLQHFFTD